MGAQVIKITFLTKPYFTLSFFKDGESNEGDEGHGSHEGNEGHEEEANLCQACQASCVLRQDRQDRNWIEEVRPCQVQVWQDRQQEEEPSRQAVSLDYSSPEGPQGIEDQGFRSCQEGHSTLQEGQGALCPVSALTNFQGFEEHQLQTWGYLRLSSAGASFLDSFGIIDEGCT